MDIAKEIKDRVKKAASEGLSQIACGPVPKTSRARSFSSQMSEINNSISLNSFNDFVQLNTHNAISAPSIRVADQEKVLVRELLYCLIGIGGNYIVPAECTVDGITTIKFNISDKIQTSLRDILQEILPLACYYYVVHKSVFVASSTDNGLVMNAFSASLRSLINDYYLSLVQLESEYRERSLSLQKLQYFVRPTMQIFEILSSITGQLDKYGDLNGASLLTFLYDKITSLIGDQNSQQIIIHLTKMTAAPYINMLRLWMLKGAIIDPQDEFMVKDNEILNRENVDSNHYSAEYWERRYTLRRDKTPKFLEPLSDCILRTGKYLNVIRQCVEHTNVNDNELIFSPDNLTTLTHFVQNAYKDASERLLKVLVKDNDLMGHLTSLKKYLLLQQGMQQLLCFIWGSNDVTLE
ncbi:Gamma-tubulin complex component 2 like [Pseudolycoriella hygida]|uniref:Gamma-tubulin complex component n=1 Tax=Pseudolycoriella hygida TaxID=35572 RepID=A0A9Q0MN38_9DIPT|nr:Gamma-tubulin complex component 2 like [Pseudolycoriella hygida]